MTARNVEAPGEVGTGRALGETDSDTIIVEACHACLDESSVGASALTSHLLREIATGRVTRCIASDETKSAKGGRPRKHESAAARQAAYRARNEGIVTWRLGSVAATISEIAKVVDLPANELAHQMLKFALSNRDWRNEPMFGRALPNAQQKPRRT